MKKSARKNDLTVQRIVTAGAVKMGAFIKTDKVFNPVKFEFAKGKNSKDLGESGLYLIVRDGIVVARTYVGDQETKKGFNDVLSRVAACDYGVVDGTPKQIHFATTWHKKDHTVYRLSLIQASRLIPMQQLSLFEENLSKPQSLTLVSRQLFKLYNFEYQQR